MISFQKPMTIEVLLHTTNTDINTNKLYKAYGLSEDNRILVKGERDVLVLVPLHSVKVIDDGYTDTRAVKGICDCADNGLQQNSNAETTDSASVITGTIGENIQSETKSDTQSVGNTVATPKKRTSTVGFDL